MRSRPKVRAAAAAALLATLALAACGEKEIDVDKAAKSVEDAVTEQVGADVKSVDCPDSVAVEAKSTFTCLVTGGDGSKGDARLTQTDDDANLSLNAPFLHTREAERIMQKQLRNRSREARAATVNCPDIVIAKKGGTFECELTLGDEKTEVSARQTDATGNFTYRVAD